jgi:hypothetical protein
VSVATRRLGSILFFSSILVSGCIQQPASPERTPPDPTGVWEGQQDLATCSYPNCGAVTGPPGPQPLRLTLSRTSSGIAGTLDLLGSWSQISVPVTATLNPDATVTVTGEKTWTFSCFDSSPGPLTGHFVLQRWISTIDLNSGKMSAILSYTLTRHLTSCYFADITVSEAQATLTRPM